MIHMLVLGLSALVASGVPASGETNGINPMAPQWLLGHWSGQGELFQNPAQMHLAICPLAGNRGITLNYRVETVTNDKEKRYKYSGHADYFPDETGTWKGRWIGSNKVDHGLDATFTDQELSVIWHNADVETGKTIYRRTAEGGLAVQDYVARKDGGFRLFAHAEYAREKSCG